MAEESPQPFYTPVSEPQDRRQTPIQSTAPPSPAIPDPASPRRLPDPQQPFPDPSQPPLTPDPPSTIYPIGSAAPPSRNKSSQTPHFSETAAQDPLILQFTDLYLSSLALAKAGNLAPASQHYSEMLKLYQHISQRPDMHDMNKDIAHFCIQDVYDTITSSHDPSMAGITFGALVGMTILLLVVGGLIATNPSIVGLVTGGPEWMTLTGLSVLSDPAPAWIGGDPHILITGPTTIHTAGLFATKDQAPLTFLATSSPGVDALVSGEYITLIPKYGVTGTTRIMLAAARQDNPQATTKQGIDVTVAG